MVDKSVKLGQIELKNPIIPASGTFGYGYGFSRFYDINILGGISLKGTTNQARFGNDLPRIAETKVGMLNAVGLQNGGVQQLISTELVKLRKMYKGVVIANISGFSLEEYVENCQIVSQSKDIDIIELNISCPNVHGGGMSFGANAKVAEEVTRAVKAVCQKPLYAKLSPNVSDIGEIALACEAAGADGLSLINTLLAMKIDIKSRKPLLANQTGGLSGPAIFPVAVRMVYQVYQKVKIPIIGIGGVETAEEVVEMMLAGASAVQVGSANLVNPFACQQIIADLDRVAAELNISSLSEIIGGAHR